MNGKQRVIIENVKPQVSSGKYPAKRVINDRVKIEADVFCDSHDMLGAEILYRHETGRKWLTAKFTDEVNDLWHGYIELKKTGNYHFTIQAWVDKFKSWHRDILKKIDARTDYNVDLLIGAGLIERTIERYGNMPVADLEFLRSVLKDLQSGNEKPENRINAILSNKLFGTLVKYPLKDNITSYEKELIINVDRKKAEFSSWYEVFPRSLGDHGKHGSFHDCISFLPYVSEMGFDVLYLPPIHPIGNKNRKGKNNSVAAKTGEPGSPWAIGNDDGGHKSIHPELGTLEDFKLLISRAAEAGIEVAMDIAFQCSPDHPYVKEHPDWFNIRPDGSLQYAENPPKRYEDIYPLNFESDDWKNLWEELKSVFIYWIGQGIKIFRVDNPHTKSFGFWEWAIGEIKKDHHDIIFLAEAFTRPKIMSKLARIGFNQSYTYFTWRTTKEELIEYCEELVNSEYRDFFRPNFWPNTPDILPFHLQGGDRAAFVQRLILASTLSSNYGIYGPAYELMENIPMKHGKEEYLNSEKYELKDWDLNNKKSLRKVISRLNRIRNENPALQNMHTLKFHPIDNASLLCYSKTSEDLENIILVIVNLDTRQTQNGWVGLPLKEFLIDPDHEFEVHDLLSGSFYKWKGEFNFAELNPGIIPAHIFTVKRLNKLTKP